MILKTKKPTNRFPKNLEFKFNKETGMYESAIMNDEVGDNYEFRSESRYAFSPSFYEGNKDLFKQLKDESKSIPAKKEADESKDVQSNTISDNRSVHNETFEGKEPEGKSLEERSPESEGERDSVREEGLREEQDSVLSEDKSEDDDVFGFSELMRYHMKWEQLFNRMQEEFNELFNKRSLFSNWYREHIINIKNEEESRR